MYPDQTVYIEPDPMVATYTWLAIILLYFYFAISMYKMAQKTGHGPIAWWAFIPIVNTFLLIKMAEKPLWWFVLLLVPFVNIIVLFALWIYVAKACNHSPIWGFLVVVPILNLAALYVLAFTGQAREYPHREPAERKPRQTQPVA